MRYHSFHIKCMLSALLFVGCTTRYKTPEITPNSTHIFKPKGDQAICTDILLSTLVSKKSPKPLFPLDTFPLIENKILRSFIYVDRQHTTENQPLDFHVDWINPKGVSIFCKQYQLNPNDSASLITSSISLNPDVRMAGNYKLRVYLFRELIAEKPFVLQTEEEYTPPVNDLTAKILFGNRLDRKIGQVQNIDSVFLISRKGWVHASVELSNRFAYGDEDLDFRFEWSDPDGKTFFARTVKLPSSDSTSRLNSSISVSPTARKDGIYTLRVSLFRKLIAEKSFEIKTAIVKTDKINVSAKASILFCSKIDKGSGTPVNINDEFVIGKNERVCAYIQLSDVFNPANKPLFFNLVWIDPDGKRFFSKPITVAANTHDAILQSSITIEPKNRVPGKYQFKLYLFDKPIESKSFVLQSKEDSK